MALTTIQDNNKLVQYTKEINREFVRENLFSPYMGDDLNAIIRRNYTPKEGGEQINIPLVTKLTNAGVSVGTLVGNEEKIDNYGMRSRPTRHSRRRTRPTSSVRPSRFCPIGVRKHSATS
jgi:hypothetical protein